MRGEAPQYQVDIQVFEPFTDAVSEGWLRHVVECVIRDERVPSGGPDSVAVVIADEDTVRDLNRRHRNLEESTDVLAFSFHHQGEYHGDGPRLKEWPEDGEFVLPPGERAGLGEVIVSYPQAARQAREFGHEVSRELAHLVAHGILHLLGYDHVEPDQEAAMKAKARSVLARVFPSE